MLARLDITYEWYSLLTLEAEVWWRVATDNARISHWAGAGMPPVRRAQSQDRLRRGLLASFAVAYRNGEVDHA